MQQAQAQAQAQAEPCVACTTGKHRAHTCERRGKAGGSRWYESGKAGQSGHARKKKATSKARPNASCSTLAPALNAIG